VISAVGRVLFARVLARNIGWSLIGAIVPLTAGVWAIPRLMERLGTERFGLLSLIWVTLGYLSLFDLGFGRALTKLAAERLGAGREAEVGALGATALKMLGGIGALVGLALAASAPWLVDDVLSVPGSLRREGLGCVVVTALTVPVVMSSSALVAVLQAHQRFASLSMVQTTFGVAVFAVPLAALWFSPSLVVVTLVLALARVIAWFAYRRLCRDLLPKQGIPAARSYSIGAELLRFGGWVTVSNLVGPLMVYSDRFVIAGLMTMSAVAYYTTPYDLITRLWVVADAFVAVMFPAFASALAVPGPRPERLLLRSIRMMIILMLVPTGLVILFASELLAVWLGDEFARMSATVLRWLAIGVFVNALARLPFSVLQASGRPDITAKLHVIELPVYLGAVWILVNRFGIEGAAAAWTFRAGLDAAILSTYGLRFVPEVLGVRRRLVGYSGAALLLLVSLTWAHEFWAKVIGILILVGATSWLLLLDLRNLWTKPTPVAAS
jgi:O-antigen/teichoic acid export membrane protein